MTDVILINVNYNGVTPSITFPPDPILPHIGLSYLASSLKKKFTVKIIDGHMFRLNKKDTLNLLLNECPKLVGITVTTLLLPKVYSFIRRIKVLQESHTTLKNLKIILGGPHITSVPESVFDLGADFGCLGDAEESLPVLCDYLIKQKGDLSKIKGIVYIDENGRIRKGTPQIIENLDSLPFPAYDLFLLPGKSNQKAGLRIIPMVRSRGCIYNCTFCSTPSIRKGWRCRSSGNVLEEIELMIKKYHPKFIDFFDEIFTLGKIQELVQLIRQRGIKIEWACQTCANQVNEELLREMHLSGCRIIRFGVESGSQRVRYLLNKRIPDSCYLQTFKLCKQIGIRTTAYFMIGLPSETMEDINKTIAFVHKLKGCHYAFIQPTAIFPGSYLCKKSIEMGKLNESIWTEYMYGKTKFPFYVPEGLTLKQIDEIRMMASLRFYLHPRFIVRELSKIDNLVFRIKNYLKFYPFLFLIQEFFQTIFLQSKICCILPTLKQKILKK